MAARARYQANRELRIAEQQARYRAKREEILEWHRSHYQAHRDEILAAKKEHRERNIEKERMDDRAYYRRQKERFKREGIRRRYGKAGFTYEQYLALLAAQDDRCAICRRTPEESESKGDSLHVDHDHVSDQIRGLLCGHCNQQLATLEDQAWGAAARAYLMDPPAPRILTVYSPRRMASRKQPMAQKSKHRVVHSAK